MNNLERVQGHNDNEARERWPELTQIEWARQCGEIRELANSLQIIADEAVTATHGREQAHHIAEMIGVIVTMQAIVGRPIATGETLGDVTDDHQS